MTDLETQGRRPREHGGTCWSDASKGQGTVRTAGRHTPRRGRQSLAGSLCRGRGPACTWTWSLASRTASERSSVCRPQAGSLTTVPGRSSQQRPNLHPCSLCGRCHPLQLSSVWGSSGGVPRGEPRTHSAPAPGKATWPSGCCSESTGRAGTSVLPLSPPHGSVAGAEAQVLPSQREPEKVSVGCGPLLRHRAKGCAQGYPKSLGRGPHTRVMPRPGSGRLGQTGLQTESYVFISVCTQKSHQDIRLVIS